MTGPGDVKQMDVTHSASDPIAPGTGEAPVSRPAAPPHAPQPAPPAATLVYLTPIGEFIHSADAKAGTILTVLGIMFTLLARFGGWLDESKSGVGGATRAITAVLLVGFALAALGAVVQAFRTISPRFPRVAPSLAFFGNIASLTPDEYVARATALGATEALSERLKYNHTGSRIILLKFSQLRWALRFFAAAAVCWLLLFGLLALEAFLP